MIDLGVPPEQSPPVHRDRLRHPWRSFRSAHVPLPLVLALLVGTGAVAVVGTERWQARQQRLADESTAALLVLGRTDWAGGGREGQLARIETSVTVVNYGPLPVEVTDIRAGRSDLTISPVAPDLVRPGARPFSVRMTVSCAARVSNQPVPIVISVRTADGKSRQVTSVMAVTPWQYAFNVICRDSPR